MMTKQQEIDQLRQFAKQIEPGSYLEQLISHELIAYFEQKVKNDHSPDIYADYVYADQQWASRNVAYASLESMHADLSNQLGYALLDNNALRESNTNLYRRLDTAEDRLLAAHAALKERNDEVMSLKAKLYDLTMA